MLGDHDCPQRKVEDGSINLNLPKAKQKALEAVAGICSTHSYDRVLPSCYTMSDAFCHNCLKHMRPSPNKDRPQSLVVFLEPGAEPTQLA
jgi:hypothetical protein